MFLFSLLLLIITLLFLLFDFYFVSLWMISWISCLRVLIILVSVFFYVSCLSSLCFSNFDVFVSSNHSSEIHRIRDWTVFIVSFVWIMIFFCFFCLIFHQFLGLWYVLVVLKKNLKTKIHTQCGSTQRELWSTLTHS